VSHRGIQIVKVVHPEQFGKSEEHARKSRGVLYELVN
jgi:hypothetical protein